MNETKRAITQTQKEPKEHERYCFSSSIIGKTYKIGKNWCINRDIL